jgi:hypothetical protein
MESDTIIPALLAALRAKNGNSMPSEHFPLKSSANWMNNSPLKDGDVNQKTRHGRDTLTEPAKQD